MEKYFDFQSMYYSIASGITDKEQRANFLLSICEYALDGIEPTCEGIAREKFDLVRPEIDKCKLRTRQRDRKSPEYRSWRLAVFERDNYTCQCCGVRGGNLNAHHIRPWALFEKERFSVDNGVTLCQKCHKEVHGRG